MTPVPVDQRRKALVDAAFRTIAGVGIQRATTVEVFATQTPKA